MLQRKMIFRRTDMEHVTNVDLVMHGHRTAARCLITQHGNAVAVLLSGVVAERVLARQSAGNVHVDVRTCAERCKRRTVCTGQFKTDDVFGFRDFSNDFNCNIFHLSGLVLEVVLRRSSGPVCDGTARHQHQC